MRTRIRVPAPYRLAFDGEATNSPDVTTTLSTKRQIILPVEVCDQRNLKPGDDFEIITDDDDPNVIVLRRVRRINEVKLLSALRGLRGLKIPRTKRAAARRVRL